MRARRVLILGAFPFAAVLMLGSFGPADHEPIGAADYEPIGAADYEPIGAADYEPIGADTEPLRSAFNADAGKVRILMLVAPT